MFLESYNCVLYQGVEESWNHLFLICTFARECWSLLGLNLPLQCSFPEVILRMKTHLQRDFFNAVILMCWTIWMARNDLIFNGNQISFQYCRGFFFKEILLVSLRAKASLSVLFDQWIQSLWLIRALVISFLFLFCLLNLLFPLILINKFSVEAAAPPVS